MKYILITGHRKSGTSLLHRLFDGHPGLNIYPVDMTFLYLYLPHILNRDEEFIKLRFKKVLKRSLKPVENKRINGFLLSTDDIYRNLIDETNILQQKTPTDFLLNFSKFWCDYFQLDKNLPFLFKETSQGISAQTWFPKLENLHVIHVVRDPRDNFAAIYEGVDKYYSKFGEDTLVALVSLILRSKLDLRIAAQCKNLKGNSIIQFERLVFELENEVNKLCKKLNIVKSPTMLEPTILQEPYHGNNHLKKKFNGIHTGNVNNYLNRIPREIVTLIEFYLKDEIHDLKYDIKKEVTSNCLVQSMDVIQNINSALLFRDPLI